MSANSQAAERDCPFQAGDCWWRSTGVWEASIIDSPQYSQSNKSDVEPLTFSCGTGHVLAQTLSNLMRAEHQVFRNFES